MHGRQNTELGTTALEWGTRTGTGVYRRAVQYLYYCSIKLKLLLLSINRADGWVTPVLLLFLAGGACVVLVQMLRDRWRVAEKRR
jgi:hypothetical protein